MELDHTRKSCAKYLEKTLKKYSKKKNKFNSACPLKISADLSKKNKNNKKTRVSWQNENQKVRKFHKINRQVNFYSRNLKLLKSMFIYTPSTCSELLWHKWLHHCCIAETSDLINLSGPMPAFQIFNEKFTLDFKQLWFCDSPPDFETLMSKWNTKFAFIWK